MTNVYVVTNDIETIPSMVIAPFGLPHKAQIWGCAECVVVSQIHWENGDVVLGNCDNAAEWEGSGHAQLKLVGAPNLCLNQRGLTAGTVDVAAKAAVTARSTANGFSHGVLAFPYRYYPWGVPPLKSTP